MCTEVYYIVVVLASTTWLKCFETLWNKFSLLPNLVLISIFQTFLDVITAEHFVKPCDGSPELTVVNIHPLFAVNTHCFYN